MSIKIVMFDSDFSSQIFIAFVLYAIFWRALYAAFSCPLTDSLSLHMCGFLIFLYSSFCLFFFADPIAACSNWLTRLGAEPPLTTRPYKQAFMLEFNQLREANIKTNDEKGIAITVIIPHERGLGYKYMCATHSHTRICMANLAKTFILFISHFCSLSLQLCALFFMYFAQHRSLSAIFQHSHFHFLKTK